MRGISDLLNTEIEGFPELKVAVSVRPKDLTYANLSYIAFGFGHGDPVAIEKIALALEFLNLGFSEHYLDEPKNTGLILGDLCYAKALGMVASLPDPTYAGHLSKIIKEVARRSFESQGEPLVWVEELTAAVFLGGLAAGLTGKLLDDLGVFGRSLGRLIKMELLGEKAPLSLYDETARLLETLPNGAARKILKSIISPAAF
ncbi:MAG: hypothetical protein QMD53_06550 [Actinomycetota bacterium]|nr:hypothetical protein [Actinomycetota bacterium]